MLLRITWLTADQLCHARPTRWVGGVRKRTTVWGTLERITILKDVRLHSLLRAKLCCFDGSRLFESTWNWDGTLVLWRQHLKVCITRNLLLHQQEGTAMFMLMLVPLPCPRMQTVWTKQALFHHSVVRSHSMLGQQGESGEGLADL